MNFSIYTFFVELTEALLWKIIRIQYFLFDLLKQILFDLKIWSLAIETVDKPHFNFDLQFLLFGLSILN